jgi:hypothetical protein
MLRKSRCVHVTAYSGAQTKQCKHAHVAPDLVSSREFIVWRYSNRYLCIFGQIARDSGAQKEEGMRRIVARQGVGSLGRGAMREHRPVYVCSLNV